MKKKMFSVLLVMTLVLSTLLLQACKGSDVPKGEGEETEQETKGDEQEGEETGDNQGNVDAKPVKIGVMLHSTDGQSQATQAFFDQLVKEIEGLEFIYANADSMDADANLSTAEGLISQGANGIITTVSTGLVNISEAAKEQDVFVATYLCKPDELDVEELNNISSFIGGVTDGPVTAQERGIESANYIIEQGFKNIATVSFPLSIMVAHKEAYEAFVIRIGEYNATAKEEDKIALKDHEELYFTALDTSFFANHQDIDAVFSLAAGIDFVYPTMVQAGINGKVKLVTAGMRFDEDTYEAINSGDIAMTTISSMEQAFYPVAMIYNAVNGVSYDDAPENGTIVGTAMMYIKGAEDLSTLQEKSYYFRKSDDEIDRLLLQPAQAAQLLKVYNQDATYAELVEYLDHLGMDAFK